MKKSTRSQLASLFGIIAMNAAAFGADPVSPKDVSSDSSESPIRLSPFTVTSDQDVGYRAANTMAGTRANELLKNIPVSISVITAEFIADVGATDYQQISQWMVGGSGRPSAYQDFGTNFRGFRTSNMRVNNVPFGNTTLMDSFEIDRVSVVRGPNSLLLGSAEPGGLMVLETKQARIGRKTKSTNLKVDSEGGYRFTADLSYTLSEKLAVRGNFLLSDKPGWRNWTGEKRKGANGSVEYRPFPSTVVRGELSGYQARRVASVYLPLESYSLWNGATPFTYNVTPAASTGTALLGTATGANIFRYITDSGKLYDMRGYGTTTGLAGNSDLPVTDTSILSKTSNFFGPDTTMENNNYRFSLSIDQSIGQNLHILLSYVEFDQLTRRFFGFSPGGNLLRRDPNAKLPDGTVNSHFGDYYFETVWNRTSAPTTTEHSDVTISYKFKPVRWMEHKIFINAFKELLIIKSNSDVEVITNNPSQKNLNNAANSLIRRVYVGSGDTNSNTAYPGTLPSGGTYVSNFVNASANNNGSLAYNWLYQGSWSAAVASNYWDNLIRTQFGTRQDTIINDAKQVLTDPVTGLRTFGPRLSSTLHQVTSSPFYGALINPQPWLTAYWSKSFSFSAVSTGYTPLGNPMGTRLGKGQEVGVRLNLLKGDLGITVSRYTLAQTNVATSVSTAVTNANTIWNNALLNTLYPGYSSNNIPTSNTNEGVTNEGNGYEAEVYYNIGRAFTITANFSTTDVRLASLPNQTIGYVNTNLPKWQALAAGNPAIASAINTNITNLQTWLAGQIIGAQATSNYKYMSNVFGKYTFQHGVLKNVRLGLGMNYRSAAVKYSSVVNNAIVSGYAPGSVTWQGQIGYRHALPQRRVLDLMLSISNLMDKRGITQYTTTNAQWQAPIMFELSGNLAF